MGLGLYGGGIGATRYVLDHGASHVCVTDKRSKKELADPIRQLSDHLHQTDGNVDRLSFRLGEHQFEDFEHTDIVIANPAIPHPWDNPYLLHARKHAIPITTEIRLLTETIPNTVNVIGITGSAGKSTTASLTYHMLQQNDFNTIFGGNIGGSLLGTPIDGKVVVVLELSSAMLYWLGAGIGYDDASAWYPTVGVITNISPNHLDWHQTFEHYRQCKEQVAQSPHATATVVRGEMLAAAAFDSRRQAFQLRIPGAHNQQNAVVAAAACAAACNITESQAIEAAKTFYGLPHRLELVHTSKAGQRFYNDSKSTTPEATELAVQAFDDPKRVHLIVGGYDKKIDLALLAALAPTLGGFYTIGTTGRFLATTANTGYDESLKAAVHRAANHMGPGDILLLSPGCASWDQFTNFEARGQAFTKLAQSLFPASDS